MSKITIITNTIRRPLELVLKSVRASLAQVEIDSVLLMDQNPEMLVFPDDINQNPKFKHTHCKVPAVSQARNRANYPADSEWLIFCDDDGYLEEGYVQKLLTLIHQHSDVEVFAGSIKRIDNQDYYSKRHAVGGNMDRFWNTKLLMGSNFVIKRSVFEALGKFDERFGAGAPYGSSEETDLAWNAFFHHKKMRYSPELVVFHVPPFAGEFEIELAKAFRYGYGKGKLVRKWLGLGKWAVLFELVEMIFLPMVRSIVFLLGFKWEAFRIQSAALAGRMAGFL